MNIKKIAPFVLSMALLTGCTTAEEPTVPNETEKIVIEIPTDETKNLKESSLYNFPSGISEQIAEVEKYPALENLIISHYDIPEDFYDTTRYYYNYVDFNNDGTDEIFVVAMGMYTSGSGGSSALIVSKDNDALTVDQNFTLINTPVIISDSEINDTKDIIVMRSGGGADSAYVKLTAANSRYNTVNDAEVIESLNDVTGTAIISNDIVADIENGTALTLGK